MTSPWCATASRASCTMCRSGSWEQVLRAADIISKNRTHRHRPDAPRVSPTAPRFISSTPGNRLETSCRRLRPLPGHGAHHLELGGSRARHLHHDRKLNDAFPSVVTDMAHSVSNAPSPPRPPTPPWLPRWPRPANWAYASTRRLTDHARACWRRFCACPAPFCTGGHRRRQVASTAAGFGFATSQWAGILQGDEALRFRHAGASAQRGLWRRPAHARGRGVDRRHRCSGGPAEQDEICARAALVALGPITEGNHNMKNPIAAGPRPPWAAFLPRKPWPTGHYARREGMQAASAATGHTT